MSQFTAAQFKVCPYCGKPGTLCATYEPAPKPKQMWTKYSIFLLIAIYFIFSYPVVTRTWNVNYTIGWYARDWKTFLLPIWFILIFLTYKKISFQNHQPSTYFFWFHVFITIIPTFFFNHPFLNTKLIGGSVDDALSKMNRIYLAFLLYLIVQATLYLFLFVKLFKR